MTKTLTEIFFLPPLTIARVGNSPVPLESFAWEEDSDIHGGNRTVIRPRVSFEVLPDGSLRPYLPQTLVFKDEAGLRPAAPFLELWAETRTATGETQQQPLTLVLLKELGVELSAMRFRVRAGNYKAARRTHDPSCGFFTEALIAGDDYTQHALRAFSPCLVGREPLVYASHPIILGQVQVIRPVQQEALGQNLDILRVRFTPGTGAVYGPTNVADGACSPLEPGRWLAFESMGARTHEVVPPANRILNPNTPWTGYVMDTGLCDDPQPADSYDGANVGAAKSWGIVDDTCEATIKAELVVRGRRFSASARVMVGQPDYAPDRRPLFSFTDELVDREFPVPVMNDETEDLTVREMADLLARVFETTSLMNLDASRDYLVRENLKRTTEQEWASGPRVGFGGMTAADRPLARFTPDVLSDTSNGKPDSRLPLSDVARQVHAALINSAHLRHLLRMRRTQLKQMIRPPFGRFSQLPVEPEAEPNPTFRDPRNFRDTLHDMQMPPYMRDSGREPLSITNRQYETLMALIDHLAQDETNNE